MRGGYARVIGGSVKKEILGRYGQDTYRPIGGKTRAIQREKEWHFFVSDALQTSYLKNCTRECGLI